MFIDSISKSKKNIANNKGFTLVELIVVLTMMAIVLTLGGLAILKWQDYATFNQENEYAQTLFVAAQNQLSEYSASGRLEVLQSDLKSDDKYGQLVAGNPTKGIVLDITTLTSESGDAYNKSEVWSEAYKIDPTGGERANKYIDDIVAIRAEAGEYETYVNDPEGFKNSNPQAYWLYEILGSYVYDTTILNDAAICVEFTPDDGQVFSVFYSDKNKSFIYSNHEAKTAGNGAADIVDRQEIYRNEHMIGFYGIEKLTKATRDKSMMAKAEIKNVKLHNENTLNLTFDLEEGEVLSLDYKVLLKTANNYDSEDFGEAFEIIIPANTLKNEIKDVECSVARLSGSNREELGTMKFMVGLRSNEEKVPQVILILDAADIHAEANLYNDYLKSGEQHYDVFRDTYSIFRLGIDMAYTKCEVSASGLGYIASESVESNVEHMCVKTMVVKTAENGAGNVKEFTLTNARHLYNIRFLQVDIAKDAGHVGARYILNTNDDGESVIDWGRFQNEVTYNRLYDSKPAGAGWQVVNLPEGYKSVNTCAFPSIDELGVNDCISSLVAGYELKNFKLDSKSNVFYDLSKSHTSTDEKPVGLVSANNGSISNITMTNTAVRGGDCVGAIAGMNSTTGEVDMCRVQNEAVDGVSSVGGMVGFNAGSITAKSQLAETISITPNVTGTYYVGGIVGYNDTDATITNYKINKGTITGEADTSCFVGGFVGLNSSIKLLQGPDKKAIDIISNPLKVTGAYYVGGCIGGNIINTNGYSNAADDDKPGDVSYTPGLNSEFKPHDLDGDLWDGNIYLHFDVYNNTGNDIKDWSLDLSWIKSICEVDFPNSSNLIIDKDSYIVRPIDHEHAKVIYNGHKQRYGEFYIHIKAPNAEKAKQIVDYIKNNGNKLGTLAYYTAKLDINKNNAMLAMVGATTFRTSGDLPDNSLYWAEMKMDEGNGTNYANYHVILHNQSDKVLDNWSVTIKFNSNVKPSSLWGAECTKIDDFTYTFRNTQYNYKIPAKGTGMFEFNVNLGSNAPEILNNYIANTTFDWYVDGKKVFTFNGGTSGGSNDPTPSTPEPEKIDVINASFKNSYAAGSINGTAFVGGYIGYNMLIDSADKNTVHDYVTKAYIDAINNNGTLAAKYIAVDNIKISSINAGIKNSDVHMWINKSEGRVKNNIGTVTADICVGGIFGYNNDETNLTIFNSDNYSKVAARTAIEYAGEQEYVDALDANKTVIRTTDYEGKDKTYYYSYAGGVIGTNNKLTVLDNCANKSSALVVTYGTYTGGLCEINDGTIINCAVDNLGFTDKEYVGGLCGLNKNMVTKCSFNTKTVGGANVVGGISAENYGIISDISLDHPSMIAYGKTVTNVSGEADVHGLAGTYTGYNGHTGVVDVEKDIVGASVNSIGRYAGLVIGYNSGKIENKKTTEDKLESTEGNVVLSGTLKAYKTAGALCGYNDNKRVDFVIANYTNTTTVLTSYGEAGGIIGFNNSVNTIKYCINEALVNASDGGNAGGITSVNNGIITNSYNYLSVNAPNGMSGGITSINYDNGNILACYVGPKAGTNSSITFISKFACGGVAAQNAGTIEDNTLKNVVVKNYDNALGSKLGVVAGENLETGEILLPATPSIDSCQVIAEANDAKMGGIAGANSGLITTKDYKEDGSVSKSLVNCSLVLDKATYASMGGVAGSNTGTISHISVDADIEGNLQAGFSGYGGIAGTSGYSLKSVASSAANVANKTYPASIIDCTFDGSVHAVGTSGNPANIGGITGINGYGSMVDSCYIGVLDEAKSSKIETVIKAGDIEKYNATKALDIISYANAGGIAGKNYGKISNIDMETAKISGKITDSINIIAFAGATGGFVGYNYEGAILTGSSAKNRVTTTDKMTVTMLRGENNRGPGGFIGVNLSGQSINYLDNYANVRGIYKANMKTGGFIGCNMQQESYQLYITNCNNFGTIIGYANVGGFVGHDWFRGIRFDSCVNYGQVKSEGDDDGSIQKYAGGFIGRACLANTPHYFVNCKNHGYIETRGTTKQTAAGGFIGQIEEKNVIKGEFYNCVNTGIINNISGASSETDRRALGNFIGWSDNKSPWNFNLCRNYNTNKVENGFAAYGICIDCLDVSMQVDDAANLYCTPYKVNESINNFYVSNDSEFKTTNRGSYSIYPLIIDSVNRNSQAPFLRSERGNGIQMNHNSPILNSDYIDDISYLSIDRGDASPSGKAYVKWTENNGLISADVYSDELNSRISVYKDIDPKFLELINQVKATNTKLASPKYPSISLVGGHIVYRWESVKKDINAKDAIPYGYEVEYEVLRSGVSIESGVTIQPFTNDKNITKTVIENGKSKTIYLTEWASPIVIKEEWINDKENDYQLKIAVRAINAYRYQTTNEDTLYDSDFSDVCYTSLSKMELPQPKVHIELTSDNRMVAVLDNPEDYLEDVHIVKDGAMQTVKMSDLCKIVVNWGTFQWKGVKNFTIYPENGNVFSEESMYIASGQFKELSAYAEPLTEDLQKSSTYSLIGNFEANGVVPGRDRYNNTTITFGGFKGDGSTDLQYDISIKGGDDSFLAADFGSYDDEKGLYVYYDRATAHLGASAGGTDVTNSFTLNYIPVELFNDSYVKDMEARVYLDESQNGIVHYGHDVIDGIVLDGENKDANYAILQTIVDENYLMTSGVDGTIATPVRDKHVWDSENNKFYPGYSLYLNPDGTYKVLYNATIELSMNKAAEENKVSTNVVNGVERKYRQYEVDVMRYVAFDYKSKFDRTISSVTINGKSTAVDMNYLQDGFYERRQANKNDDAYSAFNVRKFSDNNQAYKYFLDIAPAPIVEGDAMTVTVNAQGQKTYAVQWDKYYKDVNAWNGSYYAEEGNEANKISKLSYAGLEVDKLNGSGKYTLPTVDTWDEFKLRTKDSDGIIFYDEYFKDLKADGRRQWNRLVMNSYYYSYANAKYKAVLLGKTSSGEYVELASKDITSSTKIGESDKYSYRINYNNNNAHVDVTNNYYEYMAYQTEFTENNGEWSGYSDITIRIIRLGDEVNYGKGVGYPNKKDIDSGNANHLFVLPRFTEVMHEQKQPLTTLLPPSVAMHDNSVVAAEGSMLYDVSFGLINDTQMMNDLGGYLIEVKDTNTDEALSLDPIYYLIKLDGKTVTNYDISDDSTVIELDPGMFITNSANGIAVIDLYDFASKEVAVSVKALARDSSDASPTKYCHGEFSDGTTLTIRDALPVPVVKDSDNEYLIVEEVKDPSSEKVLDYKLTYTDITDDYKAFYENNETIVTIQAKVDIYDKENGDLVEPLYGTDSPLDVTKFAKAGGSSSANIIGDSASYDKLFVDYAGYYMRIAIKAHSNESELADSKWSDELTNAGMTDGMKCIWIQIPKIVIEDTSVISSITYDVMQYTTSNGDDSYEAIVDQQAFNILIDSNVDEYTFKLTRDESADNATVPDSITIKKVTSDEGEKWYLEDNNEITSSKIEISGFNNRISVNNNGKDFEIECKAYISIVIADDGKQYIHLIVPDALRVTIDTDNDSNFDVVENATVTNENGFIALSTLEFVSGLNENSSKQKKLADNVNKHVYKKQDELDGILAAIPAVTSDEGPGDGGVTDGAEDESTPEEAGSGDEDNDENDPVPEPVLDPVDGTDPEPVTEPEPESPEAGDSES